MLLPFESIAVIAIIAALTALGMVYAVACMIRDGVEFHDLRVRVNTLRTQRLAYLREQHEADTIVTDLELPGMNASSPGQDAPTPAPAAKAAGKKKH